MFELLPQISPFILLPLFVFSFFSAVLFYDSSEWIHTGVVSKRLPMVAIIVTIMAAFFTAITIISATAIPQ